MADYMWIDGRQYPVNPDIASRELHRIREEYGALTGEAVVEASRPEDAPLHPVFEWDDGKAAEAYRRHQATTLIRAVVVRVAPVPQPHREFVLVKSDKTPTKTEYVPVVMAVQDLALRADARQRLARELLGARKTLEEYDAVIRSCTTPTDAYIQTVTDVRMHIDEAEKGVGQLADMVGD